MRSLPILFAIVSIGAAAKLLKWFTERFEQ